MEKPRIMGMLGLPAGFSRRVGGSNMRSVYRSVLIVLASATVATAGPDWTEVGDAGSFLGSAQTPLGDGEIRSISGSLGGRGGAGDFEDMYIIAVDEPMAFRLELLNPGFDAQLFVFNITLSGGALGLLANDNFDANTTDPVLTSISTDGSNAVLDLPGLYAVAVAGAGRNPTSDLGLIFDIANPTEISGADGPGGLLRHTGWEGEGAVGDYSVMLEGIDFAKIPAPAASLSFALLGLASARRRR
jgi:hypothetical protein